MLEEIGNFIKEVGFPIAAFILMFILYREMLKRADKKQTDDDVRYETLVQTFISTIEKVSETQTKALLDLGAKLERHMEQKDAYMEFINEHIKRK